MSATQKQKAKKIVDEIKLGDIAAMMNIASPSPKVLKVAKVMNLMFKGIEGSW